MSKLNIKSKKGFTIIEVVLVLAIAGLIFLMVFVALPSLQRAQKDTQRRSDYAMLAASMTDYLTNNNGKLPAIDTSLDCQMINSTCTDPDGATYKVMVSGIDPETWYVANYDASKKTITAVVYPNAKCSDSPNDDMDTPAYNGYVYPVSSTKARAYAIMGWLESGYYCQDND